MNVYQASCTGSATQSGFHPHSSRSHTHTINYICHCWMYVCMCRFHKATQQRWQQQPNKANGSLYITPHFCSPWFPWPGSWESFVDVQQQRTAHCKWLAAFTTQGGAHIHTHTLSHVWQGVQSTTGSNSWASIWCETPNPVKLTQCTVQLGVETVTGRSGLVNVHVPADRH